MFQPSHIRRAAIGLAGALVALPASALTLDVSFSNTFAPGGLSFTPLWVAFQDGSFDAFDAGTTASSEVETLAELGDAAGLSAAVAAVQPGAQTGLIVGGANGIPTVDPGETGSATFDVDPTEGQYLSFLAMLLPSNDSFVGNDDPFGIQLFDGAGTYLGDQVIEITVADLWDAGTEVNDPTFGPAFVLGQSAGAGLDENGVIHRIEDFSAFNGLTTPIGVTDLAGFPADFANVVLATITISAVPVPLPAGGVLGLSGLAALGAMRLRSRRA